ncbi:MAG: hypothetical protein MK008_03005 [Bdellovibrionales bacterium]|nr:hypothetical protein [Bdellovibrionales bacterium]
MGKVFFVALIFLSSIKSYALNCSSSFDIKTPPNQKVARLMNQVMKHHWAFKELIGFSREQIYEKQMSKKSAELGYELLLRAEKSSQAIIKAFTLILENKDGSWTMGGIIKGSEQHKKSNEAVAEIVHLYKNLHEVITQDIKAYKKNQKISYRDIDFLVMEIMDLSEQGHRLHK